MMVFNKIEREIVTGGSPVEKKLDKIGETW